MRNKMFRFGLLALAVVICSCRHHSSIDLGRSISPHEVTFSGIKMYSTKDILESKFASLHCRTSNDRNDVCSWRPSKKDERYDGINEIVFTFRQNVLNGIEVRYVQMFDVQYKNIDQRIREQFGPVSSPNVIDTIASQWVYDSLAVTFAPNRKQHWTGSFYTYNPVLEIKAGASPKVTGESNE